MSINDLKVDIIATVSQLTDIAALKEIRNNIEQRAASSTVNRSVWKGAETDLRVGVTFDQIMNEQNYKRSSYEAFIADPLNEAWEVSLENLLKISNASL